MMLQPTVLPARVPPPPQPPEQNEMEGRPGNPVAAQHLKQAGKLRDLHTGPPLPLDLTLSLRADVSGHTGWIDRLSQPQ